jgi:hypothetical protein
VGKRRVVTTCCVGNAWYQFCIEKQDLIKYVFRKVGLSLPVDGSADHEIDIKGFEGFEVGDWRRELEVDQLAEQFDELSVANDNSCAVEFVADGEE